MEMNITLNDTYTYYVISSSEKCCKEKKKDKMLEGEVWCYGGSCYKKLMKVYEKITTGPRFEWGKEAMWKCLRNSVSDTGKSKCKIAWYLLGTFQGLGQLKPRDRGGRGWEIRLGGRRGLDQVLQAKVRRLDGIERYQKGIIWCNST